jgi:O-antigen ligase
VSAGPHVGERRGNRDDLAAAVVVATLAASPIVFARNAVDGFEQVKVWLLLTAVLAITAFAPGRLDPRGPNPRRLGAPSALALLYLGAAALSTAFSTSPLTSLVGADESHSGLATIAAEVALFLVARGLCFRASRRWSFVAAVVVGSSGAAAYALVQALGADPLTWKRLAAFGGWSRPFGTMGHPNHLGGLLAVVLPAQLWLVHTAFARGRRAAGLILALGAALSAVALVATLSRAAGAAALFGVALYVFVSFAGGRRRLALAVGAVVLALALGSVLLPSTIGAGSFVGALRERVQRAVAVGPRLQIWRAAWDAFRESPVLGSGLDTFALAFQRHRPALYWAKEYDASPTKAHNEILHALATQGIVGGVAWCAVIAGVAWLGRGAVRRTQGAERGLAAALLGGWVAFVVLAQTGFGVVAITSVLAVWAAALTGMTGDSKPLLGERPAKAWSPSPWIAALAAPVAFAAGLLSDEAPLGHWPVAAALVAVSAAAAATAWAAAKALAEPPAAETEGRASRSPAAKTSAPAVGLVAKGRTAAAIVAAVAAWIFLVLRPGRASVDAHRAETAVSAQEVVALLTQASQLDPLRVLYRRRLGLSIVNVDTPDPRERTAALVRSREVLAAAVRLVPQDAYGWASLSVPETKLAAAGLLERDEPFRSLDEALRRDPANVTFRLAGANAALELGDLERARRYAGEAADRLPDFGPARAQLAHVAAREGRLDDSIRLFREALALEWYGQTDAHHVAQVNLAAVLIRAGRLPEAERESRALLGEAPSFAPARYQLARALEGQGRPAEAAAEYEATLRLDPSHRGARDALRRGATDGPPATR